MALQITSLTPGFVIWSTAVICAGLLFGTIRTSVLVANSTGLSTSPFAYSAAGCFGLAAANTSAGAPCSISVSSAPEPPKLYLAFAASFGKTLVSDAAASTTGCEALALVLVLLLLPQPAASAGIPIVATTAITSRRESTLATTTPSLYARQNPGTILELWHHHASL